MSHKLGVCTEKNYSTLYSIHLFLRQFFLFWTNARFYNFTKICMQPMQILLHITLYFRREKYYCVWTWPKALFLCADFTFWKNLGNQKDLSHKHFSLAKRAKASAFTKKEQNLVCLVICILSFAVYNKRNICKTTREKEAILLFKNTLTLKVRLMLAWSLLS